MRIVIRTLLVVLALVAGSLYVLANHSEVEASYICDGEVRSGGVTSPETAYLELITYRPWIIWGDHDGRVWVELDRASIIDWSPHDWTNAGLGLYQFFDIGGELRGGFRVANGELTFRFHENLSFVGRCRPR
jgi:hypothetical protein